MAYVDDIVLIGSSNFKIDSVMQQLHDRFALKDMGMTDAAATPTPMVGNPKLAASNDSQPFANSHLYRSTVGMLQYLCITRPDLSFCVNKLSQYMNSPSDTH
ncbi:uncharacterized mitochondrial protein AtMg00810-like [Gossypium hirsutum]|uniref:Uncharacterized mitochondrial protein AtMg00810-like n=1 Tax=Gossypium hirsutum TaxID=3635 RepID=A0A1U8N2V1_GOSHI|nr:uncharacterized mitochondrial protein AtMg00810-like [Gossypium hirsutum]